MKKQTTYRGASNVGKALDALTASLASIREALSRFTGPEGIGFPTVAANPGAGAIDSLGSQWRQPATALDRALGPTIDRPSSSWIGTPIPATMQLQDLQRSERGLDFGGIDKMATRPTPGALSIAADNLTPDGKAVVDELKNLAGILSKQLSADDLGALADAMRPRLPAAESLPRAGS
jgi:hypothetical protein